VGTLGVAARGNTNFAHVAGVVAFRVQLAMLLSLGIEMRPRRGKARRLAFSHRMQVEGVLAGRQSRERKCKPYAGARLRERNGTDVLAVRRLELGARRGRRSGASFGSRGAVSGNRDAPNYKDRCRNCHNNVHDGGPYEELNSTPLTQT